MAAITSFSRKREGKTSICSRPVYSGTTFINEEIPMSEWQEVKSSNIAKVRYVEGGMEVQFTKGAVYRYKDVPEEVF
ncbi:KTSC domain-containing protein, partial [Candidatus Pacearchaeota archaeon]|nr:KTSC domain-containing protein [Candidatus Pacearchaeota archaeon]